MTPDFSLAATMHTQCLYLFRNIPSQRKALQIVGDVGRIRAHSVHSFFKLRVCATTCIRKNKKIFQRGPGRRRVHHIESSAIWPSVSPLGQVT
jgi:hypothetical protein